MAAWHGSIYRDGDFEYDDDAHQYRFKGAVVDGVSTILTPIVDFGDAPIAVIKRAAVRGKHVHKACELLDANDLDFEALDPRLVPYVRGWEKFRNDWPCFWTHVETPEYNPELGIAGTPDRRGRFVTSDYRILVDLKATYRTNDHVGAQLNLYDLLDHDPSDPSELWSVRVTRDGSYERHVWPRDHVLAHSLINVNRWRNAHGLTYEKW